MTVAIYPGSFDPLTNGHLDIIIRAAKLFDRLIVGVYATPEKNLLFTIEERVEMIKQAVIDMPNVEVQSFEGLTVDFARQVKAQVLVRGLRMTLDFEREFDMAMMNKKLCPELELVCFMANLRYQFLSASLLKEAARLGGDVRGLVPEHIEEAVKRKYRQLKA